MATFTFAGDDKRTCEARIGFLGNRLAFATPVAILETSDEDAEFATHWKDQVADQFRNEGRKGYIDEMRKLGEEPPVRRGGKRFAGRCSYCLKVSDSLERDHIVPFSQGGGEEPDNLTPVCRTCNSKKKDRGLLQFVAVGGIA